MKKLNTLLEEYPEFFKLKERLEEEGPKMPFPLFGFECDDGWYVILERLFSWINFNIEHNDYPRIIVNQIKEKFGGLRFYYDVLPFDEHVWKRNKDYTDEEKWKWLDNYSREISGAVSYAESLSRHTCERCGSTKDVTSEGSWIITRCKKCRDETR